MVISYPELIKNNMQEVLGDTPFHAPFLPLADKKSLVPALVKALDFLNLKKKDIAKAVALAWEEQENCISPRSRTNSNNRFSWSSIPFGLRYQPRYSRINHIPWDGCSYGRWRCATR